MLAENTLKFYYKFEVDAVELCLSGLTGTARRPVVWKSRMIGFFFEDRLNRQFEVRLLIFTVCTWV
jgi:hypothetical protein